MKHERTIWDLYTELFNNPTQWKYYSSFDEKAYSLNSILDDGNMAIKFIRDYFEYGGKNMIAEDIERYCKPDRAAHSISTFFLGITLLPLFKKRHANAHIPVDNIFLWLWFLTCLYHDMAYKFEDNRCFCPSLGKFSRDKRIQYKIFGNSKIKLKGANKKTVRAYYQYRIKECGCVDHGIVGGMLLYDSLRINYEKVYQDCQRNDSTINHNDFYWDRLHFSESHFGEYEKCANAIIQHNLWFKSQEDRGYELYKKYHLDDLTYLSDKPYYKDWLTALLVFCDSIEPLKRFPSCNPSSLLRKIKLKYDENEMYLEIGFMASCMNVAPYINGILKMNDWTNMSVKSNGNTISFSDIDKIYK